LIDRAYEEVVNHNGTIDGPTPISRNTILDNGQPSKARFVGSIYRRCGRCLLRMTSRKIAQWRSDECQFELERPEFAAA